MSNTPSASIENSWPHFHNAFVHAPLYSQRIYWRQFSKAEPSLMEPADNYTLLLYTYMYVYSHSEIKNVLLVL